MYGEGEVSTVKCGASALERIKVVSAWNSDMEREIRAVHVKDNEKEFRRKKVLKRRNVYFSNSDCKAFRTSIGIFTFSGHSEPLILFIVTSM